MKIQLASALTAEQVTGILVHLPLLVRTLSSLEMLLYDIKCLDPLLHRQGTGCGNERILENLERLLHSEKPVVIRTPVIPGFQDERELERIAAYCRTRELPWQTLPYHSFGEEKKRALQPQSGQMSSKTLDLVDSDFKF